MKIVGRTQSRTYRPELCISLGVFGAQAFNVTAFAPSAPRTLMWHPSALRLLQKIGLIKTWQNFAPCIILHFALVCTLHNLAPCIILRPLWDSLGLYGTVWNSLGLSGPFWDLLWNCLGLSGTVWDFLEPSLGLSGTLCQGCRICGSLAEKYYNLQSLWITL